MKRKKSWGSYKQKALSIQKQQHKNIGLWWAALFLTSTVLFSGFQTFHSKHNDNLHKCPSRQWQTSSNGSCFSGHRSNASSSSGSAAVYHSLWRPPLSPEQFSEKQNWSITQINSHESLKQTPFCENAEWCPNINCEFVHLTGDMRLLNACISRKMAPMNCAAQWLGKTDMWLSG